MIAAANPKIYILILHTHITPHAHCTSLFSHTEQYDAMKTCTELATRKTLIWRTSQVRSSERGRENDTNPNQSKWYGWIILGLAHRISLSAKCTCVQNHLHTCQISFTTLINNNKSVPRTDVSVSYLSFLRCWIARIISSVLTAALATAS